MPRFVELDTSVFDPAFTLNPYPHINDLYEHDDVIGFSSDGINFLFKFEHCREVMFSKNFARPTGDESLNALEMEYAKKYPTRAQYFMLDYSHGEPDLKLKSLIVRLIAAVTEKASLEVMRPLAQKLTQSGRIDDYIDEVTYLPLKLYLDVCGLEYNDADLKTLHEAGCQFLQSFETPGDEKYVAQCDAAIKVFNTFVAEKFSKLNEGNLLYSFIQEGLEAGIAEDKLRANLGNVIIVSLSNTFGISSAFVLRNMIKHPEIVSALKADPSLLEKDDTITEILRLDNHVKALSRAATKDCEIGGYQFKKGEVVFLFFPGLNHDPAQWANPDQADFTRIYDNTNNLIFGGSIHLCIGKKLTFAAMKSLITAFLEYLPDNAEVIENDIEMDGTWLAERIITKMPILLPELADV